MEKRILAFLLAGMIAVVSAGCGSSAANETGTENDVVSATESTETDEPYGDTVIYDANDYVTLGDYLGMEVTVDGDYEVTDEDIRDEIELELAYFGTTYEETDKTTVEEGDTVNIDYVGKKDGVAFDGGTGEDYNLTIGSGTFIPGFEDGLIGAEVGDIVDLELTFPEEYQNAELAGQDVVFTVTVNSIVEPVQITYETLTDEFIQDNVGLDSVEAYIDEVREVLEEDKASEKETAVSRAILLKLPEICTVSGHPEGLEEERIEQNVQYYADMASAYGTDLETMLGSNGMTEESLRSELAESVKDTVDVELILLAIADAEGITNDEEAYQAYVADILTQGGYASEEELYKEFKEAYVRRQFCQDKARELVEENAKITFTGKASAESTEEEATEAAYDTETEEE